MAADPGWNWFEPPAVEGDDARLALARICARLFSCGDGEQLLAHLTGLTVGRCLGPEASEGALRALEGQRQLVHHILSLIQRGRDGR